MVSLYLYQAALLLVCLSSIIVDFSGTAHPGYFRFASASSDPEVVLSSTSSISKLVAFVSDKASSHECHGRPIILSMANIKSPLYTRLMENFFATMERFRHTECAVLICVSDKECMKMCTDLSFVCYDYRHDASLAIKPTKKDLAVAAKALAAGNKDYITQSTEAEGGACVMEQVATLKILAVSQLLDHEVNLMLLDIDVGFRKDPSLLYDGFLSNPNEQVRAQMDVMRLRNPSTGVWYTSPRINFGVFIIKSHPMSKAIFKNAWIRYQQLPLQKKCNVAVDQNVVGSAITTAHYLNGFNYSYFDVGFKMDVMGRRPIPILPQSVYLLHKMDHVSMARTRKPTATTASTLGVVDGMLKFELGGQLADQELGDAVAVHATCYERTTKLLALQVSNTYLDKSGYFDPSKRTITKPMMMMSKAILKAEIIMLIYIGLRTNRAVIIPNALIGMGTNVKNGMTLNQCLALGLLFIPARFKTKPEYQRLFKAYSLHVQERPVDSIIRKVTGTPYCIELWRHHSQSYMKKIPQGQFMAFQKEEQAPLHRGQRYWPGFRIVDHGYKYPHIPVAEGGSRSSATSSSFKPVLQGSGKGGDSSYVPSAVTDDFAAEMDTLMGGRDNIWDFGNIDKDKDKAGKVKTKQKAAAANSFVMEKPHFRKKPTVTTKHLVELELKQARQEAAKAKKASQAAAAVVAAAGSKRSLLATPVMNAKSLALVHQPRDDIASSMVGDVSKIDTSQAEILIPTYYHALDKAFEKQRRFGKVKSLAPTPHIYMMDLNEIVQNSAQSFATIMERASNSVDTNPKKATNQPKCKITSNPHRNIMYNSRLSKKAYIEKVISELNLITAPRVVINIIDSALNVQGGKECAFVSYGGVSDKSKNSDTGILSGGPADLLGWADDSVGSWNPADVPRNTRADKDEFPAVPKYTYLPFPYLEHITEAPNLRRAYNLCGSILRHSTNSTCYDKC